MNNKYEFFIAGRARNKENILKICALFDKYKISYYCFLKNEDDWGYGNKNQTPEEKQKEFESLSLKSYIVLNLFHKDLEGEKNSKNLLLVLPAGKATHIESGIAYRYVLIRSRSWKISKCNSKISFWRNYRLKWKSHKLYK